MFKLKNNTIFIADSHYSTKKTQLYILLNNIYNNTLKVNQLILMGDIFDFLSDDITYFKQQNIKVIDLLNKIGNKIEVIYFEGNHDFNLKNIFPNIIIIPRYNQPIPIIHNNITIKLAHGDIFTPFLYNLYCTIIRNKLFLQLINLIDINNFISKKVERWLNHKSICHKNRNFNIDKRIKNYNCDLVIEGHFHQEILTKHYINIPSLHCSKKYLLYKDDKFSFQSI